LIENTVIVVLSMSFFYIDTIFFEVFGYQVSYLEFSGLLTGLIAVILSSRANILSWPIGIVNVVLSFFLFFQVQLYPDMFLQVFFFATNLLGWWRWLHPRPGEEDRRNQLRVSYVNTRGKVILVAAGVAGTLLMGRFSENLNELAPSLFSKPSAFPYIDSFIMVMSIITTFYMIQKKIESWIVWIIVDAVATWLYFQRGLILYALLYFAFCFIAAYGLYFWIKEYRLYQSSDTSEVSDDF
jgi:nicotinamide mononucleotide transporter